MSTGCTLNSTILMSSLIGLFSSNFQNHEVSVGEMNIAISNLRKDGILIRLAWGYFECLHCHDSQSGWRWYPFGPDFVFSQLYIVYGLLVSRSSKIGFNPGSRSPWSVREEGAALLRRGIPRPWKLRNHSRVQGTLMFICSLLMWLNPSILLTGRFLDRVLSSLGLPAWFRHVFFECHADNRLRFKLFAGSGEPWTRDGRIPHWCLLSMMILEALYLPWCRYLEAQECVMPWLYIDNFRCVACDPDEVLYAARFTTGYVRLVGQEPAPCKCVLISTSKMVRNDMRDWVLSQEGDRRSLQLDVRDLGVILIPLFVAGLLLLLLRLGWWSRVCWIFMRGSGCSRHVHPWSTALYWGICFLSE